MAGYTHANLREVQDQAPTLGMAPDLEARFARQVLECEQAAGSGRFKLGDDVVEVRHLDALLVASGTTRCDEAGPDGLEFVVFGAPRTDGSPNDAQMVQDWWND